MDLQLLDFYQISHVNDYKRFKDKSIVITGATGFIGGYLTRYFMFLNDKHHTNISLYLSVRSIEKAQIMFGNREDIFFIWENFFQHLSIDYVFHCASNATPAQNEDDITGVVDTNVLMTRQLLEEATKKKAKFVFFSAGEVYGPNNGMMLEETIYHGIDPCITRNNYGLSKLMGENLCYSYHKKYGTAAYVVRLFHTYGIGINLNDPRIFAVLIKHIIKNKSIYLHAPEARRAFCYISDVISGVFTILEKGHSGEPYNIGYPYTYSIAELAEELGNIYNIDLIVNSESTDNSSYLPYCAKLQRLGWTATVPTIEGFKHTIDYYKECK